MDRKELERKMAEQSPLKWLLAGVALLGVGGGLLWLVLGGGGFPSIFGGHRPYTHRTISRDILQYTYLDDFYVFPNVLGSFQQIDPPRFLLDGYMDEIAILPEKFSDGILSFYVASGNRNSFEILNLYITLNGYARCSAKEGKPLRDPSRESLYALHISPRYSIYPLYPLRNDWIDSYWILQKGDHFRAQVDLCCEPRVLYLISVHVDYVDLNENRRKHSESNEFALLKIADESEAHCQKISSWFDESLRITPVPRRYDECVPPDFYRFLTLNVSTESSRQKSRLFDADDLFSRKDELEALARSRPGNPVFAGNLEVLDSMMTRRGAWRVETVEELEPVEKAEEAQPSQEASGQEKSEEKEKEEVEKDRATAEELRTVEEGDRFTLQIASLRNGDNALNLARELQQKGYASRVEKVNMGASGVWYRVRIGGFASREEGQAFAQEFLAKESMQGVVMPLNGR